MVEAETVEEAPDSASVDIGPCLRSLREGRGLSLRALAQSSGLSVNTVSLIENGRSSPSVSTLQKISMALDVPMIAFFLSDRLDKQIVYTRTGQRRKIECAQGILEDLGEGLSDGALEPLIVTIAPHADSGFEAIAHTGYEFICCLGGRIAYIVENKRYTLEQGDSLFFEAHLPHFWQNLDSEPARLLLVLCPNCRLDRLVRRHLTTE